MKKIILWSVCLAVLTSMPAAAEKNGLYLGGGIGGSSVDVRDFDDEFGDISFSDGSTSYKLFAGYRFMSFFAVEAGYVDLGSPSDTVSDEDINVEISLNGWDAFAVGILPIGPVDLFAKAGFISWDSNIKAAVDDLIDSQSDSGTDMVWGLGIALRLGSLAVRVEGERYEIQDADEVYSYMVGATWTF